MNEVTWLAEARPLEMIEWMFFDGQGSDRKFRLFSVACVRALLGHLQQFAQPVERLLEVAEAFADGRAAAGDLTGARDSLAASWQAYDDQRLRELREEPERARPPGDQEFWFVAFIGVNAALAVTTSAEDRDDPVSRYRLRDSYRPPAARPFPSVTAATAAETAALTIGHDQLAARDRQRADASAHQRRLVLDVFGNPFRPVVAAPSWRTPGVVALAGQMYETRKFDLMNILADALQDAGCDDHAVLDHCQGPGPHTRGCWVVDAVLDKS